jgi:hypothetical protein
LKASEVDLTSYRFFFSIIGWGKEDASPHKLDYYQPIEPWHKGVIFVLEIFHLNPLRAVSQEEEKIGRMSFLEEFLPSLGEEAGG